MTEVQEKIKVLVVEDDSFLRELISKKLSDNNFEVIQADNGALALEIAKKESLKIILLDLIIPEKDGFEVLQELKSDPRTQNIPVVILSNLGQKEEIQKGLNMGAVDFLVKAHFTPDEILAKVKQILGIDK